MLPRLSLKYISDIHLEKSNKIPYQQLQPTTSNNLALLGDIGNPFKSIYNDLLKYVSSNYDNVFLIAGNHEYWTKYTIQQTNDHIHTLANKYNNIHFLNNTNYKFHGYNIIGSTLWSNELSHPNNATNYSLTKTLLHNNSLNQINKLLTTEPTIMLTHYMPTYKLIHPAYEHLDPHIKSRYASDLEYMMSDNICVWLTGHSHKHVSITINNTFCSLNPLPDYCDRVII